MKTICSVIALIILSVNSAHAKPIGIIDGTNDSVCLISAKKAVAALEKIVSMNDDSNLEVVMALTKGKNNRHTFAILSSRSTTEAKIYSVEVDVREVGQNRELFCEIATITSALQ